MIYPKRLSALLFASLMLISVTGKAATDTQTERLRIMTYNIPMGNIPAEGLNTWANRCKGLQDFLNEVKPDLLGLQEPVRTELMNLLSGMPGYTMLGRARDDGRESGEYSPILYRTERLLVEHTGTYWLSLTPDVVSKNWNSACNRVATWAVFRDKQTGARFLYTNTHLDHKSDSAREHQMEVIKQKMVEQRIAYGVMPMMLTGDFNVQTTGSAYNRAANYLISMEDAWLTAKSREGSGITWFASNKKIDFIMLTTGIEVETAYTFESQLPSGQILSDHNPHYADIHWETKVNEQARATVLEAQASIDSLTILKKTSTALITNAKDGDSGCQLYCDAPDTSEGQYYRYLTDGSFNTYFHSLDTGLAPNNPHYLQVDLQRNDITAFTFDYARRNHSNYGLADRWVDVLVTGSNDGTNWDYITELDEFGGEEMISYSSPVINMHKPYRHVRFSIQHTPAMKIRNGHPQFSCSEFQMYRVEIDSALSQRCRDATLKSICEDELQPKMDEVMAAVEAGNATKAQIEELKALIEKLRHNKIETELLQTRLKEARQMLIDFSVGTGLGQTTESAMQTLQDAVNNVSSSLTETPSKALVDNLLAQLTSGMDNFMSQMTTFETNKWYYITSSTNSAKKSGRAIYVGGNSSTDSLYAAYYNSLSDKITCQQNPYAMWRIVEIGEGEGYALQNRATGFYFGGMNKEKTAFVMAAQPKAWRLELKGTNDCHLTSEADMQEAAPWISSDKNGLVYPSEGGHATAASWTFQEVNDEEIGKVEIPVQKNAFKIMSLPFAIEVNPEDNPNIKTYAVNSMPTAKDLLLEEKTSFASGEAFFILTGDLDALEADSKKTVTLKVNPPTEISTEGGEFNGLTSTLDDYKAYFTLFYVSENALRASNSVEIPAHSGYLVRSRVKDTGNTADLTVTRNGGITGITVLRSKDNAPLDVYGMDGRLLRHHVAPQNALEGLQPGIYIVGKQKVLVTD